MFVQCHPCRQWLMRGYTEAVGSLLRSHALFRPEKKSNNRNYVIFLGVIQFAVQNTRSPSAMKRRKNHTLYINGIIKVIYIIPVEWKICPTENSFAVEQHFQFDSATLDWRAALIFICLHEKSISAATKNGNEHTIQRRTEKNKRSNGSKTLIKQNEFIMKSRKQASPSSSSSLLSVRLSLEY